MNIRKIEPRELVDRYLAIDTMFNYYDLTTIRDINSRFVELVEYQDGTEDLLPNFAYCFFKCPTVELKFAIETLAKRDKEMLDKVKNGEKVEGVDEKELLNAIHSIEKELFGKAHTKESKLPEENAKLQELVQQVQKTREDKDEKPFKSLDEAINSTAKALSGTEIDNTNTDSSLTL